MASPGLAGSTAQRDRRTWLIVGVHPDASATSKGGSAKGNARIRVRLAGTWRAEWNEDVIVLPVRGYRMGVESGGHVFDPGIGYRIDHSEHGPAGIIPSRHVEAVISLVEPNLIGATHLRSVERGDPDRAIKSVSGRTLKLPDHLASRVDFPDYWVRSVGDESISVFQALRKTQERPKDGWLGVVLPNERR